MRMAEPKASDRMNELIRSIQHTLDLLEQGKLDLQGLDQATGNARALYERFVVLRHKAREAAVGGSPDTVAEDVAPAEPAPICLDTRPVEVSPNQTSLIDAIAESEHGPDAEAAPAPEAEPAHQAVAKPKRRPKKAEEKVFTLADKLEHAPVADLGKAIALSEKFWFTAELFGNDRKRYEQAIEALNAMASIQEAERYLQAEVITKLEEPPEEGVMATFTHLLQRRFS